MQVCKLEWCHLENLIEGSTWWTPYMYMLLLLLFFVYISFQIWRLPTKKILDEKMNNTIIKTPESFFLLGTQITWDKALSPECWV